MKTIAYLTSAYARASDSFVRAEVLRLREMGHEVITFSITEPPASERVDAEVQAEHARTEYILGRGLARLAIAAGLEFLRSPARAMGALRLALRCGWPGWRGRLWPLAYIIEACYLARRLRERGVAHLHNHIGEGSAVVAMLASALSGVPYSLTIHGPGEFDRPERLALGEKIARSRFTAAISDYGRSQLMRWTDHAHWPRIRVIRCGVQLPPAVPEMPATPRFVCVGRLAPEKGHLVLVDALARLRDLPPFEVTIVGDGPTRACIESIARERGVADRLRIAGWGSAAAVREAIAGAQALLVPSFAEGLPVVIMEAFALGRPVIAAHIAAIPELVRPRVSGWLVAPGSDEALAEAMREALSADRGTLARMGEAGRALVRDRHDQRREVERLRGLIQGELA